MKHGKGLNFFETAGRVRTWFSRGSVPADSALIYEVHSDGAAGKLDGFPTIWWDKITKLSYFFACFNSPYPSDMDARHGSIEDLPRASAFR